LTNRKRILTFLLLAFVIFNWAGRQAPEMIGLAASPAGLTLGKTVIPEGDDFATRVLGLPWDMNGEPYPDRFTALKNIHDAQFKVTADGFWEMKSLNSDPRLWLHWTGVGTTQRVLRMGDTRPIDAAKYKLLSYYMCLDQAPSPQPGVDDDWGVNVYWMYDRTPHDDPANGRTKYLLFKQQGRFKTPGSCELITFDLSQPSAWSAGSWNNNPDLPMGLRIDPINQNNQGYRIGWVRLTTLDTSSTVPFSWSGAPAGTNEFYLSLTGCGQAGILVGEQTGTSGTFQWGAALQPGYSEAHPLPIPESFEPGTYFLYMKDAAGAIACAGNNPLKISAAPILEFQKPSFQSGPDYGATVVSDPWGMTNSQDIDEHGSISNLNFNDGILAAISTSSDPRLFLNVNQSINTNQFRYVTFRMRVNGTNTEGNGWVQRFIWWYQGPTFDSITTEDLQIYDGWHNYTIDLETAGTENCSGNCWSGFPTTFRFDPFEANNTQFFLDYVVLTGIDTVVRGNTHTVHYTVANAPDAEVTFYYDTDKNPDNGRNLLHESAGSSIWMDELLGSNIFLPMLFQPGEIDFFTDSLSLLWDTAPVQQNTYFISADVFDGVTTTTWYSEAPVIVK
jgi:hypothetical protein